MDLYGSALLIVISSLVWLVVLVALLVVAELVVTWQRSRRR